MPTIIAISDTHGRHRKLTMPPGDILVHAGDITPHGELEVVADFNDWLATLPYQHKLVIAGNHDFCFENTPQEAEALLTNCTYLRDQTVTIDGINFYGSPWQPWFFNWAFNLNRGPDIRAKWDLIPTNTDILITHGPPYGHGDRTITRETVGCQDLLDIVTARIQPTYHIFGHIHEARGQTQADNLPTHFINASSCSLAYRKIHPPLSLPYPPIAKFE